MLEMLDLYGINEGRDVVCDDILFDSKNYS